jgi:ABC-type transport system involved in multi-copper enzyme maturation permease subunit
MTVLTMPGQPGQGTDAPRPVPWRRMAWVTWRQHRATFISAPAVLVVAAVILLIIGLKAHHEYTALLNCQLDQGKQSVACSRSMTDFNSTVWPLANICSILMQLAPVLLGAFAGAPLLARELESGTFRYAWTQGLRRERQAVAKLVLVGGTLTVLAWVFGVVFAWFFQPFLWVEQLNQMSTGSVFDTRGLVFPAFTLVSFVVAACLGMLFRRIIPAMAATLGVYLVLRLGAWAVRGQYPLSVVTSNAKQFAAFGTPGQPGFPWILSTWVTGPGGKPAGQAVLNQAQVTLGGSNQAASVPKGYTIWTRWIPMSHYWPLQIIEAGWLLVLAIAIGAAAVWLVRRRAV